MSVYRNDRPEFFDRALKSITEEQTIKPDEIVLVVDGPVPSGTEEVIAAYSEMYPVFKVIRLEKNGGLGNALRLAVEQASNELIARMDSDDISLPDRFESQLRAFEENPDADVIGGDITEFIDDEKNVVAKRTVPKENAEIREYIKTRCPMNHVSVMYKKSSVLKCGSYIDLFWNEDYYLWIRMFLDGAVFGNTGTVLVNVCTGKDMYSRRGGMKYFRSERFLQKYMLKNKMIRRVTYLVNCAKRFVLQVLMPNRLRGWVFRRFARKSAE